MFVETSGRRWSSERITTRPFGSVYFSNLIVGRPSMGAAAGDSVFAGAFFGGVFFSVVCPETDTAATAAERPMSNKRLKKAQVIPVLLRDSLPRMRRRKRWIRLPESSKDYTISSGTIPAGNPVEVRFLAGGGLNTNKIVIPRHDSCRGMPLSFNLNRREIPGPQERVRNDV